MIKALTSDARTRPDVEGEAQMNQRRDYLRRSAVPSGGHNVPVAVLSMSMSLDGYIAGLNDKPGNPGGDGFSRLHEWGFDADGQTFRSDGPGGLGEILATGAVVSGRNTAEQVDH